MTDVGTLDRISMPYRRPGSTPSPESATSSIWLRSRRASGSWTWAAARGWPSFWRPTRPACRQHDRRRHDDGSAEHFGQLAKEAGLDQIEFRAAYIEDVPVEEGSVACVISNGVINLSPDKPAGRIPGGRPGAADRRASGDRRYRLGAPPAKGHHCVASPWAACIGGAAQRDDYLGMIRDTRFEIVAVRDNDYRFISDRALGATGTYGVTSISVLTTKS